MAMVRAGASGWSVLRRLADAMGGGYPVAIRYTSLEGETTDRTIEPAYKWVAKSTGNEILTAFCELRGDWRSFVTDGIEYQDPGEDEQ